MSNDKFEQPIFGANYCIRVSMDCKQVLSGEVPPLYGLIPVPALYKVWSMNGGCSKFLTIYVAKFTAWKLPWKTALILITSYTSLAVLFFSRNLFPLLTLMIQQFSIRAASSHGSTSSYAAFIPTGSPSSQHILLPHPVELHHLLYCQGLLQRMCTIQCMKICQYMNPLLCSLPSYQCTDHFRVT